jgi:transcriptional regulator with XRE-family HTH domain
MPDHRISTRLSRDVSKLLLDRGMTLTEIAKLIGVTKSYMSRVNSGDRSLTIEHLMMLEREIGQPLPLLLIDAIPLESVPAHLRPLYESTRRILKPKDRRPRKKRAAAA